MGMTRKSLSVGTFGKVSFRSTKEQLRRAESARAAAERALERDHAARVSAESRVTAAERRVARASEATNRASQRLARSQSKRGDRRAAGLQHLFQEVDPTTRRARAAANQSAREGKRGAIHTLQRAHDAAVTTKEAVPPPIDRAVARATEAIDHIGG